MYFGKIVNSYIYYSSWPLRIFLRLLGKKNEEMELACAAWSMTIVPLILVIIAFHI